MPVIRQRSADTGRHSAIKSGGSHPHCGLSRRFSELAVFDARFYIGVRWGRIRQCCAVKEPHVYMRGEYIHIAEGCISQTYNRIAVMCKSSRTSSPHFRITSDHRCAMAPNSPACSFIHASMAGSRSTAPLNRSNSVLIVATLESAGLFSHGVLRGTCWFQGATLSSYAMGSPKPSV